MRCSYSTLVKAKRSGRASSVKVQPTGTAVSEYQVNMGQRNTPRPAGVVRSPCWSDPLTETETWVRVPRLSTTCPRRIVAFTSGRGNIDRTFEFGDDFDGTTINAAKWTGVGGGSTVSGGVLTMADSTGTERTLTGSSTFGQNHAIRMRKSATIGTASYVQIGFAAGAAAAISDVYSDNTGTGYFDKLYTAQTGGTLSTANHGYDTSIHIYDVIRNGSTSVIYRRDGSAFQNTTNLPTGALSVYAMALKSAGTGGATSVIYWIVVRKYVASEPIAGTVKPSTTNRALCKSVRHSDLLRACCNKV